MKEKTNHNVSQVILGFFIFFSTLLLNHNPAWCDWLPQEKLSSDIFTSTTSTSNQCDIAFEASGNIHVVWLDDRDNAGSYEVYYRKYTPGIGWGLETRLTFQVMTTDEDGNPIVVSHDKSTPGIVADSSGNLYVSYENTTTQTPCVKRFDSGTNTWDLFPTELGAGGLSEINPVLAVDGSDNIHAVWRALQGTFPQVFYRKYTPNSGWGSPEQVTTFNSQKKEPMLTVDSSGNVHVVWADDRDNIPWSYFEIYYIKKPASGGWGTDTRLSFAVNSDSLKPYITSEPSGDLHLVWEDNRHGFGNFEIYYLFWTVNSGWSPEERLTNEPSPSLNPHLAVDPSGQIHLIWQDGRYLGGYGSQFSLYYKKKTSSWGDDNRLSRKGYQGSITADSNSNLHVVYTLQSDPPPPSNPEIYYLKYDPTIISSPSPGEIVLVLDISGSMGMTESGGTPVVPQYSRLYKAGQALRNFLDRYNLRNPTDAYFGLVTFPHSNRICPSAENVIPGQGQGILWPLNDANRLEAVNNIIPGLTANGYTPMAEGLTLARGLFSSSTINKMILLVSDGYHNCPGLNFPANFMSSFTDLIYIYTVGIGTAVEVDLPRLDNIARDTGGEFRDATTTSPNDMISWFKTIIQDVLGLEAECDPPGTITMGQKKTHNVLVTDYDTDIAFDLSWSTAKPGCIDFILHTPEGKTITADNAGKISGITHISRETYQLYYLKEEYLKSINRAGKWTIELVGKQIEQDSIETYHYGVLMDSPLKILAELNHRTYRTGEPVGLQVVVLEEKKRLPANVKLNVYSPKQGLGNWHANYPVTSGALLKKQKIKTSDPLSNQLLKTRIITEEYQKPFPDSLAETSFILYDDGTHGDLTARDGIYTTIYSDTTIPGTYTFDIIAEGKTSSGQEFRREKIIQRYVNVNVKEEYTVIKLTKLSTNVPDVLYYKVTITPKDALGNHLGPGFADHISVFVKGASYVYGVQDNLDGTYSQVFYIPVSMSVKRNIIKVRVLGIDMAFCL